MLSRGPKSIPAHNALLYERFLQDRRNHYDFELFHLQNDSTFELPDPQRYTRYSTWLAQHGIHPDTGTMTAGGIALFTELLEEQNARNMVKRRERKPHR